MVALDEADLVKVREALGKETLLEALKATEEVIEELALKLGMVRNGK